MNPIELYENLLSEQTDQVSLEVEELQDRFSHLDQNLANMLHQEQSLDQKVAAIDQTQSQLSDRIKQAQEKMAAIKCMLASYQS